MTAKQALSDDQLIQDSLKNFRSIPDTKIKFMLRKSGGPFAGTFRLSGPWGERYYVLKVVPRLTQLVTELVIHQFQTTSVPEDAAPLLISHYIPPRQAAQLKARQIEYADCAGNIYLNRMPLYIEISGQKHPPKAPGAERLFRTAGLKLLYLFLRNPRSINATYRVLADDAGIALGAIGDLFDELSKRGNLQTGAAGERQLLAPEELLQRWQIGYLETLRSKLFQQRCQLAGGLSVGRIPELLTEMKLGDRVLIGGELGAALLTRSSQPQKAVLYLESELHLKTMLQLRLSPDPEGNVTLLQPFGRQCSWTGWQPQGLNLADPLLSFAELDGARTEELAQRLYRHYLQPRFVS